MAHTSSLAVALVRPAIPLAAPAAATPATSGRVAFVEPAESFLRFAIRNFLLTLATCGVYYFWARVEARKRLMGALSIDGTPLTYTGSGREGFTTFMVAALVAAPAVIWSIGHIPMALAGGGDGGTGLPIPSSFRAQRLFFSIPLMFFIGSAVYRRRTHILRRTWLAGRRFNLTGDAWSYALRHVTTAFTVPPTLGWLGPWRMNRLGARLVREMTFDGQPFHYTGSARGLYRHFTTLWVGGLGLYLATLLAAGAVIGHELMLAAETKSLGPLLALHVAWRGLPIIVTGLLAFAVLARAYRAEYLNHHVSHVVCGQTRLSLRVPALHYAATSLGGSAMKLLTFGALTPVADAQMLRLIARHLDIAGPPLVPAVAPAPVHRV